MTMLNELNDFLKETDSAVNDENYKGMVDIRDKLLSNNEMLTFIDSYADITSESMRVSREEAFNYITRMLTLFVFEGLLKISDK